MSGWYSINVELSTRASSAKEAYRKVLAKLSKISGEDFNWEFTNEWWNPVGFRLSEEEIIEITSSELDK